MSGEDPYASPQSSSAGVPDAPESFGWEIVGKRVWVEKFAQFPMVDPYSGISDEVMTLNRLTIRLRPIWLLIPVWVCIGMMVLFHLAGDRRALSGTLEALALLVPISFIGMTFFPLCGLKVFYTKRTLRIRAIQQWVINGCFIGWFVGGMTLGNSRILPSQYPLNWIPAIAFAVWILGLIWQYFFTHRLVCRRRKDGRFEIRGFHPQALEKLAAEPMVPPGPQLMAF